MAGIIATAVAACQTQPPPMPNADNDTGSALVSTAGGMPEKRPGWMSRGSEASEKDGFLYFVGGADNQDTEIACKNAAFAEGVRVIARHAGVEVTIESVRRVREEGGFGGIVDRQTEYAEKGSVAAKAIVSGASVADFFWEQYEIRVGGRAVAYYFKCWDLVKISRANLDRASTEKKN